MIVWRRLAALPLPYRWEALAAVALGAATLGSGIGLMATSAWLIATAALHPSIAALGVAVVGVRVFGLSRGVWRYLERLVAHDTTLRLLAGLRAFFYAALEPLAPARLVARRSGDLLARLVADVETLENIYLRVVGPCLSAVLVSVLVGLLLGGLHPALALVGVSGLALGGLVLPALTWRLGRESGARFVARRAEMHAHLVDGVQGLADLVGFGREEAHAAQVEDVARTVAQAEVERARVSGVGLALVGLTADLTCLGVLLLAVPLLRAGHLSGPQLAVAVLVTLAAFEAVAGLPAAFQGLSATRAAAERLFEVIDTPPAVTDPPAPAPLGPGFELCVRGLRFAYPGAADLEQPVLEGLSLDLAPGRIVALVGASGAGKSTLLHLLLRFWDVPPGAIRLNGRDVREYAADDVRARFAFVPQRAAALSGTLRENLELARSGASDAELHDVLRRAGLEGLVAPLAEGLDTWVGEHGVRLSGGERQRLALARALLSPAPCLLLDEPTAHLDAVSGQVLWREIVQERATRAVLLVTHRLVGIEGVDEILRLDSH